MEEESILLSSDSCPSEPEKPLTHLLDDPDLDFLPKTKLSDILGSKRSEASSREGMPPEGRHPEETSSECCDMFDPPPQSFKRCDGDNPKVGAIIHELSDSGDSKESVSSRAWFDTVKTHSPGLPMSPGLIPKDEASPIQLHDGKGSQSSDVGVQDPPPFPNNRAHMLSDSDDDTIPAKSPPRRFEFDNLFSTETMPPPDREPSESSQSTLPPPEYFEDSKKSPTRLEEPIDSSKTATPRTWALPKVAHELSDSDSDSLPDTDSSASFTALPQPGLELLQAHSEPILNTTSYQISQFVSQEANSQPLDTCSGMPNRKKAKQNSVDILERKRLKELKLKEKKERAELTERFRRMRPKECMKYITVVIHEDMASECSWASEALPILASFGIKYKLAPSEDPCIVKWTRDQPDSIVPREEKHVLFLWSTDRLVTSVKWGTLADTFACMQKKFDGYKVYLGIYDLHDYYKRASRSEKQRKNHDSGQDGRGKSRTSKYEVTEGQIRLELCRLLMDNGISHKILDSPEQAAEFLEGLTQAVAELPFKLERDKLDAERDWFVRGVSKNCVRVDSEGNGFKQLWIQQLAQFNNATLDTAKAIVELYPTPFSLYTAYKQCSSKKEQEKMLQDILVRKGPGGAGRRLGPELSRRVSILFCQDDGDVPLN